MGYNVAINNAWEALEKINPPQHLEIKFLADNYSLDIRQRKAFSLACNVPAKDFTAILLLHYALKKIQGLPELTGRWLPFRELAGIEGYYPAFRQRSIEPVIRKYGNHPEAIYAALERLPGEKTPKGDAGVIIQAFEKVPCLISLWRPDDEFGPDANIFFDKSINAIFCIEDIVVLAGFVAGAI